MALIVCSECGKEFSDKAAACPNCGCPTEFANIKFANSEGTEKTKSPKSETYTALLRDYLEKIRLLETDAYTFTEVISKLRPLTKEYPQKEEVLPPKKPLCPSPPKRPVERKVENVSKNATKAFGKGLTSVGFHPIAAVYWGVRDSVTSTIETVKNNRENEEWYVKAQEWYNQDVKRYHEHLLPEYEKQMAQYEESLREYEEKVKEESARYSTEVARIKLFNQGIIDQIEITKREKEKTENALKQLYDIGIIFPKYRGIIPVTMFCEYMDSGRRTELEGVHGMYDLYEQELLGKQIVGGLNQINSTLNTITYQIGGIMNQLTGIARNQIMLHEEIARGNEVSKRISRDTSELLSRSAMMLSSSSDLNRHLGEIHRTMETSAYNAEVTARRVDAIAKIEEYEFALRHPAFPSA